MRRTGDEDGVLIAHGSVNSGYCLLVENNRLVYDYNYYGDHYVLRSEIPVPAGRSVLAVRFLIDSDSTSGTGTLLVDGQPAGEMRLAETFEHFIAFQGLDVGADRLSPVRQSASGEFPFAGELVQVVVDILDERGGQPYVPCD